MFDNGYYRRRCLTTGALCKIVWAIQSGLPHYLVAQKDRPESNGSGKAPERKHGVFKQKPSQGARNKWKTSLTGPGQESTIKHKGPEWTSSSPGIGVWARSYCYTATLHALQLIALERS